MSRELPFVVECKSTQAFHEPIAAFNVESVARDYAKDCGATNPAFAYRVTTTKEHK